MTIKPNIPRTTPISVKVNNVKVRYDPVEHADGLTLPDDLGRALVKSGHWTEVQPVRASRMLKVSTNVDKVPEEPAHDGIQD